MTRHYTPRALATLPVRLESGIIRLTECGCWIWMGSLDPGGYGTIKTFGKNEKTHRASWKAFVGPIPDGLKVLHTCDIRCCINPDHLFIGTQADNVADMIAKGRGPNCRGERNANSKITAAQAKEIKNSSLGVVQLGELYGLRKSMVSNIKRGENWND